MTFFNIWQWIITVLFCHRSRRKVILKSFLTNANVTKLFRFRGKFFNEILSESVCNTCKIVSNIQYVQLLKIIWDSRHIYIYFYILLTFKQNISCTHFCILSNVLCKRFRWVRSILSYSLCVVVTKDSQQKAELDKVKVVVVVSSAKSVPSCCFFPQPRV